VDFLPAVTYLFPIPESPSPRLAWLAKHGLITRKNTLPHAFIAPADRPWICCNPAYTQKGFGFTEEEAILDYCELFGLTHWTVEELNADRDRANPRT
jgi:hypothetical protein